jgi:hypothetical protein
VVGAGVVLLQREVPEHVNMAVAAAAAAAGVPVIQVGHHTPAALVIACSRFPQQRLMQQARLVQEHAAQHLAAAVLFLVGGSCQRRVQNAAGASPFKVASCRRCATYGVPAEPAYPTNANLHAGNSVLCSVDARM